MQTYLSKKGSIEGAKKLKKKNENENKPSVVRIKKALNPHHVSVCEAELMGFSEHSESIPLVPSVNSAEHL